MTDAPPDDVNDTKVEGKFKKWFNEVLDERAAKEVKPDPPVDDKPTDDKTRTNPEPTMLQRFIGW